MLLWVITEHVDVNPVVSINFPLYFRCAKALLR